MPRPGASRQTTRTDTLVETTFPDSSGNASSTHPTLTVTPTNAQLVTRALALAGLVLALTASCAKEAPPAHVPDSATVAPRPSDAEAPHASSLAPARFERATGNLGLDFVHESGADGRTSPPRETGAHVVLLDVNNDARLDLYLTNGAGSRAQGAAGQPLGRLYIMERERFVERTVDAGLAIPMLAGRALGARAIDFDGDGDWDLVVSFVGQDRLMRNDAGRFTEVPPDAAFMLGVLDGVEADLGPAHEAPTSFTRVSFDANLDGHADLLTLDGELDSGNGASSASAKQRLIPRLFLGTGVTGDYFDASALSGPVFDAPIAGRGFALGDLDGDSDVDVVVIEEGGPAQVWLNQNPSGNRPLRLVLLSRAPNTYALGAELELTAGALAPPQRTRMGQRYLSQHEHTVTFGLGDRASADVTVRWPDGRATVHRDLKGGLTHVLH